MRISTKYIRLLIFVIVFFGLVIYKSPVLAQTYGLKFKGESVTLDKRTELNLSPDGFLKFQDEFEISFDYKTTRIYPNSSLGFFGYVFRIISKDDTNVDLLSTPTPKIGLNLVLGKSNTIIPVQYSVREINNWIKLRIKFLLNEDKLIFQTPDSSYVQENVGFDKQEYFKIIFGTNDYKQFMSSDVPSMTIKDVEIYEKGKLKYNWLLNEKEGTIAADRIKGAEAKVVNPMWLMQNHAKWRPQLLEEINGLLISTANLDGSKIFMLSNNEITIYDAQNNSIEKHKYVNNPLFFAANYRAIYNDIEDKIYCYSIDAGPFYILDLKSFEWTEKPRNFSLGPKYSHHNSYYNPTDNCIYTFGGYGAHRYRNSIWKFDLDNDTGKELPINKEFFEPRYLFGIGALNDTIYLLGGHGSETGNQLINPHSYFDLIGYSIKDNNLFEKFEIPRLIDDMVVANTIWINPQNRDYYALIFSKIKFDGELQLIKGNLDSPEIEEVGNKIPFKFLDVRSMAYLYYLPNQDKLYALTTYTENNKTQVAIYSIDNPPNKAVIDSVAKGTSNNFMLYIAIAFVLLILSAIWIVLRRKKYRLNFIEKKNGTDVVSNVNEGDLIIEPHMGYPKYNIIFFGGFQLFNKDFEDITNKFSPLLKELFLLILLHTYKNNKGISSNKITEVLWYDKSEKSARNNMAVYISKLRGILEEVGSCELSKKTGYWKIELKDSNIKSDYVDFLSISASKNNLTKQNVTHLIEITRKGAFFPDVYYDWLDDFKANVSDRIIDTLVDFAKSCDVKKDAEFIVYLSDCIFNFDPVDEDAMILKCKAQYCMGKHSHAKATYAKFSKEYKVMYDQEYDKAFIDILEIK